MNYDFREEEKMVVDIHNQNFLEAKYYLERLLVSIDITKIREIIIIHGHRGGTKLQNLVRKDLKSKKIERRLLTMNPGRTSLILKSNLN